MYNYMFIPLKKYYPISSSRFIPVSKKFYLSHNIPDVTRNLGDIICNNNSKSFAEMMSFIDLVDGRSIFTKSINKKTLTFYKSIDSKPVKIEVKLPAIDQSTNLYEVKRNIAEQVYPRTFDLGRDINNKVINAEGDEIGSKENKNRIRKRNVYNISNRINEVNKLYNDSLEAMIGKIDSLSINDKDYMMYYLISGTQIDPRLIFFDAGLKYKEKVLAIKKLAVIINENIKISKLFKSLSEEDLYIPIIITRCKYNDRNDLSINIPYNFDPSTLETSLEYNLPSIIKLHKIIINNIF